MKQLSQADLEALMQRRDSVCVSIYAPMVKAGPETQQNPIRFKNLVRGVSDTLEERGMTPKEAARFLRPATELIEDTPFWQHQSDGLAVFLARDFVRHYRVPLDVRELAVVEERFHLKPLLPMLSGDGRFYILALSQKQARLLEATRHRVREVDLGDLPTNLSDALGYEVEETHIQYHTGAKTGGANQSPVYHGQGGGEDDVKLEIRKFFNLLDKGIGSVVSGKDAPLVLAGVEFLFPLYRQVSDLSNLLEGGVPGNPDELTPEELHERAWPVVEPVFTKGQEEAVGRFRELAGTGQASTHLEDVVRAADDGRVDTLFVALGTRQWGTFDRQERTVELSEDNGPGTEDLLDFAAIQTVLKGGKVYAVTPEQVPEGEAVAAVYRY
jgi:hypothetical protein